MYPKIRQDAILEILKKRGYTTVKYLTEKLFYSTATINRDLNELERQKLIKRSYGGAQLTENHGVLLPYRYDVMKVEKRSIAKTAAGFVKPGDVIFIDGSTTTQSMAQYLTEIKDINVITCNIAIVSYLSERGVSVICLGGEVSEPPSILSGNDTVMNAMKYHADKMFFATGFITADARIGEGVYQLVHSVMANNSDKVFYLADHEKISKSIKTEMTRVDCIISDYKFPEEVIKSKPNIKFVHVKRS